MQDQITEIENANLKMQQDWKMEDEPPKAADYLISLLDK